MSRIFLIVLAFPLALFLLFSSETQAATITVTTADDVMSTDGQCSLREAIIRANTDPVGLIVLGECDLGSGDDEIRFDPSLNGIPIELSIAGSGEDASGTGDLDIVSNITIRGNGVDNTVIDANSIDRVFHIIGVSRQVTMLDISITGGLLNDVPGSGISNAGTLLLDRVSIHTNVVTGTTSSAIGGGIFNSGQLAIFESTIDNNTADRGSGIFSNNLVEIFGSTISNNTGRAGVGVINFGGLGIFNSTISKNNASNNSGGVRNSTGGTTVISNSTIVENGEQGIFSSATGNLTIENSIVANNSADDCSGVSNILSQGNNLDSDGSCGFVQAGDISNTDPMIGPLEDNGGPTLTHALLSGSPAVDAGNNATCENDDQRGTVRPQDGDDNGAAVCDMGALEMLLSELIPQVPPPGPGGGDGGGGCSIAAVNNTSTAFPLYLLIPAAILFRRLRRKFN